MPLFVVDYILEAIIFVAHYGHLFQRLYQYYPTKNTWTFCPKGCPWDDFGHLCLSIDESNKKVTTYYLTKKMLWHQINDVWDTLEHYFSRQQKQQ
jgi:hypothetical protein